MKINIEEQLAITKIELERLNKKLNHYNSIDMESFNLAEVLYFINEAKLKGKDYIVIYNIIRDIIKELEERNYKIEIGPTNNCYTINWKKLN